MPCRLPVGSRQIEGAPQIFMELVMGGLSLCASQYAIRPKVGMTMIFIVKFMLENECTRAELIGDTERRRKIIPPHDDEMEEVD